MAASARRALAFCWCGSTRAEGIKFAAISPSSATARCVTAAIPLPRPLKMTCSSAVGGADLRALLKSQEFHSSLPPGLCRLRTGAVWAFMLRDIVSDLPQVERVVTMSTPDDLKMCLQQMRPKDAKSVHSIGVWLATCSHRRRCFLAPEAGEVQDFEGKRAREGDEAAASWAL